MSDIKLVFFDMEGTILRKAVKPTQGVAPSLWTLLAQHLSPEALEEEEISKRKWNNKEFNSYTDWMAEGIRVYQKYGLTRSFFEEVMNSVQYHPRVQETFTELRERGYLTALISGGFKAQADKVQVELKINHALAGCELFWEGEKLVHWNLLPSDYDGKHKFMEMLLDEHRLTPKQSAFVGDGVNDIRLAQEVGLSIAFNGDPRLQAASTYSVNQPEGQEDFREILKYL